jgi:hypothetical protein
MAHGPLFAVLAVLTAACAAAPRESTVIQFRAAAGCGSLEFRAQVAGALPVVPLAEVVVAVNGEVCHREGMPGHAIVYGEVAALCGDASLFEPGANLVEVAVVPPGCGARRPIAVGRVVCVGPEPD